MFDVTKTMRRSKKTDFTCISTGKKKRVASKKTSVMPVPTFTSVEYERLIIT